jgi:hypothetical protein
VVVDGLQKIRPGVEVRVVEAASEPQPMTTGNGRPEVASR